MDIATQKQLLRSEMRIRRKALPDREGRSARIFERLQALPCWRDAKTVLVYLSVSSEVQTDAIVAALVADDSRRCVVPWCREDGVLGLFHLISPETELAHGIMSIPEPTESLRARPERIVAPEELDLVLLPGLAFDRRGGRLGQGGAYYDRLLTQLSPHAVTVGLAFDCQIVPEVPRESHDQTTMKWIMEHGAWSGG